MSLFLGKIHYWLFNKILWFENLEEEIINCAKNEGLDISKVKAEIEAKYGAKLENKNLEEIIDTNNIHGWLQDRIHKAEGRMAAWTKFMIKNQKMMELEKIYIDQAHEAANEVKAERTIETAKEIFDCMNDYILDGMPCDNVNQVIESDQNAIRWIRRVCVHRELWEEEGVNVSVFYTLRGLWIKEFVHDLNNNFEYIDFDDKEFCISRKS
ncbi:hypothetical protein [Intestinibacter bartlettii]|uniref:Uncharacterized protein n=1 Tax=Intestinibacter bartlettii TaxID=261299 RepID=A0ABS6DWD3_9FIRM|nr:hypothetical protein [Intestinibacter bartlettii]MBU5336127.1 hypothetical protein [Intestinibacter bartlettii]